MKTRITATCFAALIATGCSASAADLAARPYTKAPPPMVAPIYNWGGFYIGGNGGYGTSRKCFTEVTTTPAGVPTGALADDGCHNADGATAGGQIGYRWQAGQFVYGLEGQGNWANFRGSSVALSTPPITAQTRIDAFGLITGQVGYAWNNVLLYAKGGAAIVASRYNAALTNASVATGLPAGTVLATANDDSRWGATVGAGLEFGFAPNWSVGVEYNHIFLGTQDVRLLSTGNVIAGPAGTFGGIERVRGDIDMITARVNYHFGGPVVARY